MPELDQSSSNSKVKFTGAEIKAILLAASASVAGVQPDFGEQEDSLVLTGTQAGWPGVETIRDDAVFTLSATDVEGAGTTPVV